MKALIIASVLFFSLRAMSGEVGEVKKTDCNYSNQSAKREAKVTDQVQTATSTKKEVKVISK